MNNLLSFLLRLTISCCSALASSCSFGSEINQTILLVGCTPGDGLIKSQLGIPTETTIDFIKWTLRFDNSTRKAFVLDIVYGESQPNTSGFKRGGQKRSYQGEYLISRNNDNEIYLLKSGEFQTAIALLKLNANIFHLLTPQKQLMIGNGGWSYTLNRQSPDNNNYPLPPVTGSARLLKDTSIQVIYEGRTPCQDFAVENNLAVTEACFKLKWKLILNKDPRTLQPSTYLLKRTGSRDRDITGNWAIVTGTKLNPAAIIVQLDPDKPNQSISLFAGDENVLFFLHKDKNLAVGNDNFSFTLNRRYNPTN